VAESFLPPVIVELGGEDTGAVKAIESLITALGRVPEAARVAADAMKLVQDAAVAMGDGIQSPLDAAKTSIRSLASALRALAKTATATDDEGKTAMQQLAASAKEMGASVAESATAAKTSMSELGASFKTTAGESVTAAGETTAAAKESAAAAAASGDAAAASGAKSAEAMGETSGALMKYATGLGATAFGIFEAVKGATSFNTEMLKINTQAAVSKSKLSELGNGVLALAGQVGENPDSLAESLFHVESNFSSLGISAPKALGLVKIAAEGAQVGGANLVDVTNALTAAVASNIPGVQNMSQAMGALNAIVGSGDMTMQDLADSFGSGMVATVKGFGLSLTDVGAALATFGDNNVRGAKAGTDLRMAVQALAQPVSTAGAALKRIGASSGEFAADMRSGGLLKAMDDLTAKMKAAGIGAKEQGQIITDIFGKKAGSGINILADQMDRLRSKYPAITDGANKFGSAWQTASHSVGQEYNDLKGGLEALGIKIGTALMPALSKVLGLVRQGISWVTQHKVAVQALVAVIAGGLIAAVWGLVGALTALEINPVVLTITGIAAALIFAYTHFKAFREVVNEVAKFLGTVLVGAFHLVESVIKTVFGWFKGHSKEFSDAWSAVVHTVQALAKWFNANVIQWIRGLISDFVSWWKAHAQEISEVWGAIWTVIKTYFEAVWEGVIKPGLVILMAVWKTVWGIIKDSVMVVWDIIKGVVTTAIHYVMNVIGVVLDLITGHWSKAWHDMLHLVGQLMSDIGSTIIHVAEGFGTLLYDAGKNVIKGLINGIKSMIGGIGGAMGSVANTIRSFLPFSPAKQGPLSGSGSPDIAGAKIGEMVATGMTQSTTKVTRAGHSLAGAAKLALTGSSGSGAELGGLALTVGAGGAAGALPPIIVQVDGKTLFQILQVEALRNNRRNPTSGLVLTNR
jgi:TP901 family phage tail tape measure protein